MFTFAKRFKRTFLSSLRQTICFITYIIESLDLDQNEDAEPVFRFTVQVRDNGKTIQHSATSDVILRMRRVNEYTPMITSNGTSLTIDENEAIGTVLYRVSKLKHLIIKKFPFQKSSIP